MTFLNPVILWALAAISIPVIIHLLNLRKTRKIEFSTLMFLKEIHETKHKRIKLKQLLILLCRIALISFLVLAFAKPFVNSNIAGSKASSSILIIIDDTFSMQGRNNSGVNFFEDAKSKAVELLSILSGDNEVNIVTASSIDEYNTQKNVDSLSITTRQVSPKNKTFNEILFYANNILTSSIYPVKEIILITDLQKSFLNTADTIDMLDKNVSLHIINTGNRMSSNISVDSIDIITKIMEVNKPVKVVGRIRNHNSSDIQNVSLVLSMNNNNFRSEKLIDIPAENTADAEFIIEGHIPGYNSGNIEISLSELSDDELRYDNKRFFTYHVPQEINILLVSGNSESSNYIRFALSSVLRAGNTNTIFKITEKSVLSESDFNIFYNCIILNEASGFNSIIAEKLNTYNNNGGGIMIIPRSDGNTADLNSLVQKLAMFDPYLSTYNNANLKFEKIETEHPIIDGIFRESDKEKIRNNLISESPEILSGYFTASVPHTRKIITLSNNASVLMEYTGNKGSLIIFGISLSKNVSDFYLKNLFAPIIVRSVLNVSGNRIIKEALAGRDYFREMKDFKDTIILSNNISAVNKIYIDKDIFFNFKPYLNNLSFYTVQINDNTVFEFPCNAEPIESIPDNYTTDQAEEILNKSLNIQVSVMEQSENLNQVITEIREGKEFWPYFMFASLLFLGFEMYLSRKMRK